MIFSLTFLSIYHFGITWMAHMLLIGGAAMTVALFREAERREPAVCPSRDEFGHGSACVWKLGSEA